ncbi:ABC transporter permease [Anaerocolumna xylanovorans]|uniref:ABC-2 family transporter protein n=1 Tax=Anaerocolumna xylanovorans DSM 12503 TaxID=1121345 RepID=A0A1M7YMW5_9FIRM|nr:ABC transporter permease [Anaerocolumna xylanovorans]SHO54001.1 ABC-2 family transporter protein [Anaerocolumna xylanovorans DSM 12503]
MKQYMKSEFYRIAHRMSTYLFIGMCSLLMVSSNVVLAVVKHADAKFPYATTKFSISNLYASFAVVYLLCIAIASMIFGNEYGNRTMKNSISYGISRGTIYFGKLITEMIYAVIAFAAITGIHVASACLLLENSGAESIALLLKTTLFCFPLFIFAVGASNCFIFLFDSMGNAIAATLGLLLALPLVSNMLGMKFEVFHKLAEILPWNLINNMEFDFDKLEIILKWNERTVYYYWMAGIIQMVLVVLAGYLIFNKREIK